MRDVSTASPTSAGMSPVVIISTVSPEIPEIGSAPLEIETEYPVIVFSRSYALVAEDAECSPGGSLGQNLDATTTTVPMIRCRTAEWSRSLCRHG